MQRRKFLIGTGGAIATAAFGPCLHRSNREPGADVSVVTDDDATAALMFTAQTGTSISGDGQLVVDGLSDLSGGGDAFVTPTGRSSSVTMPRHRRRSPSR